MHTGDHDVAFHESAIGETLVADLVADTPQFLNSDAAGALPAGRWLIQIAEAESTSVVVWVGTSAFEKDKAVASVSGAGNARIPLSQSSLFGVETHLLGRSTGRITLEAVGGTAKIWATRVSRQIPRR